MKTWTIWVLLWLSPHEKREFGGRTATAARGRDPDIDGERALRRTCGARIPPSHQRHNRRDVPISHPTSQALLRDGTDRPHCTAPFGATKRTGRRSRTRARREKQPPCGVPTAKMMPLQ